MVKELIVVFDIYDDSNKAKKPKLVQRNIEFKRMMNTEDMESVDEFLSIKNKPVKSYCLITTKRGEVFKVKEYFEKAKEWIMPSYKRNLIGFKYRNKNG